MGDIIDIVNEINRELYDNNDELDLIINGDVQVIYSTDGYHENIKYLNILIWRYDEDEREWIEDCNDYEPLKPFLIKKIKEINNNITKIVI